MGGNAALAKSKSLIYQPLPRWIHFGRIGAEADQHDSAFVAGAATLALDRIIRDNPPWLGCWQMRLVLGATVSAARLLGLAADEAGLRDALHLTRTGDDPGSAGRLHGQLRDWSARPLRVAADAEALIAKEAGRSEGKGAMRGRGELAALLAADRALAEQLGWPSVLPLHLAAVHQAALRPGSGDVRLRAGEPGWETTQHAVLARGAIAAHALAIGLSSRAEALTASASRLRTRDGGRGLALILNDDSVAPWRMAGRGVSHGLGSDRAARRLCESLHATGALRLLTGRPAFRLYGL